MDYLLIKKLVEDYFKAIFFQSFDEASINSQKYQEVKTVNDEPLNKKNIIGHLIYWSQSLRTHMDLFSFKHSDYGSIMLFNILPISGTLMCSTRKDYKL